jgi:hypothetical protein
MVKVALVKVLQQLGSVSKAVTGKLSVPPQSNDLLAGAVQIGATSAAQGSTQHS